MTTGMTTSHAGHGLDSGRETAALLRVRAGVRAALALGVAASVTANVLHAQPSPVGRAIAAWPSVALLLTIELISRVPPLRPGLTTARMAATGCVAAIAAWVSYWHMAAVAARYGEASTSAHLIPLSVDGLVIVASVCLVEIAGRVRSVADTTSPAAAGPVHEPAAPVAAQHVPPRPSPERRHRSGTAAAIARLRQRHPDWTATQIAERAGVSERTVRRHLTGPSTRKTATAAEQAA